MTDVSERMGTLSPFSVDQNYCLAPEADIRIVWSLV
jgi:hypothetical protein